MKDQIITCSMCGHQYDPSGHPTCEKCPLQFGCYLTCCPQCGYETVDPQRSTAARWLKRLLPTSPYDESLPQGSTLADVPPGCEAQVEAFDRQTPSRRKAHLQAYGVVPGHTVRVLQHRPVTVIKIEHLELALENELAKKILVCETDTEEGER